MPLAEKREEIRRDRRGDMVGWREGEREGAGCRGKKEEEREREREGSTASRGCWRKQWEYALAGAWADELRK